MDRCRWAACVACAAAVASLAAGAPAIDGSVYPKVDEALTIARAASDAELRLTAPLGLPIPIKPALELRGELLLEAGRAADAGAALAQPLERNANRSLSLLGPTRAAVERGDRAAARRHSAKLLANYSGADTDLPLLGEAQSGGAGRDVVEPQGPAPPPDSRPPRWLGLFASPGGLLIVALAIGGVVLTWLVARASAAPPEPPTRRTPKKR